MKICHKNICDLGLAKDFSYKTQKVRIIKEMFVDLHFLKINISILLRTENGRKIKSESYKSSQIKSKSHRLKENIVQIHIREKTEVRSAIKREVSSLNINK